MKRVHTNDRAYYTEEARRDQRALRIFSWGVAAALVAFLSFMAWLVLDYRTDRDAERAACVAAGGVPVWQKDKPYLCFDRDLQIEVKP